MSGTYLIVECSSWVFEGGTGWTLTSVKLGRGVQKTLTGMTGGGEAEHASSLH
jgi:hypothetical protein